MKIKLQFKRTADSAPEYYYTNLFVVTEWERLERRNIQQLSTNPLYSDYCCWMHTLLKLKGEKVGNNWREWVAQNPDIRRGAISPGPGASDTIRRDPATSGSFSAF